MKLIDKIYNKVGYKILNAKLPIFIIIGIYLIEKNHIYMLGKYIRYLDILNSLKNSSKVLITGTGVLVIFFENKIIKYPLGKHSLIALKTEYSNYLLLRKSNLKNMVNYKLEDKKYYYQMDLLVNCRFFFSNVKNICSELSKINIGTISPSVLLKNDIFTNALACIKKENNNFLEKTISFFKFKEIVKTNAMHGDLTQFNIMKNSKGEIVLIDLDRFTFNGIEKIDRIHFIIEYYAKKRKNDFFVIIENIINNKKISEKYFYFLFFYFIYRVGVEYDEDVKLPHSYSNKVSKLIKLFLVKHREGK